MERKNESCIKNIIFDMVGVVMRFDTETYMRQNHFSGEDVKILENEVFRSLEWARQDRGTISDEEAEASICKRTPPHLHRAVHDFIYRENRALLPVEGMEDLLKRLKEKGYRVYLLSNISSRWHHFWKDVPGHQYFDDTLISADVGLVKPQPEIFRMACEKFHAKPEESVFIDDMAINAEAAFYIGMRAFVFHSDIKALEQWLLGQGI